MTRALNATGRLIAFSCSWPAYHGGLPPQVRHHWDVIWVVFSFPHFKLCCTAIPSNQVRNSELKFLALHSDDWGRGLRRNVASISFHMGSGKYSSLIFYWPLETLRRQWEALLLLNVSDAWYYVRDKASSLLLREGLNQWQQTSWGESSKMNTNNGQGRQITVLFFLWYYSKKHPHTHNQSHLSSSTILHGVSPYNFLYFFWGYHTLLWSC